jgi:hypothetical protein
VEGGNGLGSLDPVLCWEEDDIRFLFPEYLIRSVLERMRLRTYEERPICGGITRLQMFDLIFFPKISNISW